MSAIITPSRKGIRAVENKSGATRVCLMNQGVEQQRFQTHSEFGQGLAPYKWRPPGPYQLELGGASNACKIFLAPW
jgi:hypothetical protein